MSSEDNERTMRRGSNEKPASLLGGVLNGGDFRKELIIPVMACVLGNVKGEIYTRLGLQSRGGLTCYSTSYPATMLYDQQELAAVVTCCAPCVPRVSLHMKTVYDFENHFQDKNCAYASS